MRKVKFCQDMFDEKLGAILTEFPMLDVRRISLFLGELLAESVCFWYWNRTFTLSYPR